ncbi:MAG: hypothetical protein A2X47_01145 [Lentisphaerae bacterium GWF2_38_69]|nr:MAG: hypothetical protein A2X47_01145 [Lentisphaerae bacterium GWF2_38_69]
MLQAAKISLFGNIFLFLVKTATLFIINSLAILTDLGISLVGLIISIILYHAVKVSNKPADVLYNYGYGKIENICEAMEGIALTGLGLFMIVQAITNLFDHPMRHQILSVGLICSIISVLVNLFGAHFIIKLGEKSKSPAIKAEGLHYKLEGYISLAIAISFVIVLFLRFFKLEHLDFYVDSLATIIASVMILIPSFHLAKEAFFKLLDSSIEEQGQMGILKMLSSYTDKFCDFKDIKTRCAGRKHFVEFKLVMPHDIPIAAGHKIISDIEKDIKADIQDCEVIIKMEPCDMDCVYEKNSLVCPYKNN